MQETEMRVRFLVPMIPWRRKWQPTPVFLPGKSHGQRSLIGYSLHKESQRVRHDWATEHNNKHTHTVGVDLFLTFVMYFSFFRIRIPSKLVQFDVTTFFYPN